MTGSSNSNSSSLPTKPSFPIANSLSPGVSHVKRWRRKDGLTWPPLQQQLPLHHPSTKTPSQSTLDAWDVATSTLVTNAQSMAESVTNAAAFTWHCLVQKIPWISSSSPQCQSLIFPGQQSLITLTAGPILTNTVDPAAGTGRANSQAEVDCCSTSRSPSTKHSYQSPHQLHHRSRCILTPYSQDSIELAAAPLKFNSKTYHHQGRNPLDR